MTSGAGEVALWRSVAGPAGTGPKWTMTILIYSNKCKSTWIDLSKRWPSLVPKIQNKIWICRELNKEQISLLVLFKIRDRIWIKTRKGSRCWIWTKFDWVDWNFQELVKIWIRSSWLHLEDGSTHEREFVISNLRVFDMLREFDLNFDFGYLELD
jgi:hypothetical protein